MARAQLHPVCIQGPSLRSTAGLADWRNFYTSNLSVKTELLRDFPFEKGFPYAAMEISELGYQIIRIPSEHHLKEFDRTTSNA
jgi:hypothetical protein